MSCESLLNSHTSKAILVIPFFFAIASISLNKAFPIPCPLTFELTATIDYKFLCFITVFYQS
jgi:hypothetical protein